MADTTLKAYYAYLDDLLNRRKYDEVVAHCQHILAKFPKNLGAVRRLAKAQLENGQYDEATASYGRVLSYSPYDVEAYVGLSWVSRQRNQGDNTIYYLERAYEREPNNSEVIGLLRDAYRVFHDRANAKLPNTPYMVARQQVRSGLSTQAVKTLQDILSDYPQRTDLRLLLTDIYAQIGQLVDAAKTALAVLKELPDCVRANQVLATVWLGAGRPSDAQRLVARIEDVDPYLAYEVATGESAPADSFTLPMFEYRTGVGAAVQATPDWMSNLDNFAQPTPPVTPPTPAVSAPIAPKPQPKPEPEPEPVADADWLAMIAPTEDTPLPPPPAPVEDLSWLGGEEDPVERDKTITRHTEQWVTTIDPAAPSPADSSDDWLAALAPLPPPPAPPPAAPAESEDWLTQLDGMSEEDTRVENQWLEDIDQAFGAQTVIQRNDFRRYLDEHHAEEAKRATAEQMAAQSAADTESDSSVGLTGLLSLLSANDEMAEDNIFTGMTAALDPTHAPVTPAAPSESEADEDMSWLSDASPAAPVLSDGDDPFAWMQGQDIEVVEPSTEVEEFLGDALGVQQMGSLEPAQEDALAWAQATGVEFENDADDGLVTPDDDPFAWMRESGVEFLTGEVPAAPSAEPQLLNETPGYALVNPADGDTLFGGAVDDADGSDDEFWASEAQSPDLSEPAVTPDEVKKPAPVSGLLAFVKNTPQTDSGGTMGDNNDIPDWLKSPDDEDSPEETPADTLDWLAELQPSDTPKPTKSDVVVEDSGVDESVPAWMVDLDDMRDHDEISHMSTVESPILETLTVDEVDSGLFDSLTVDGTFADPIPTASAAPVEDAPDWLFAEPPTTAAVRPAQPEPPMPAVSFDPHEDVLLNAPPADVVSEAATYSEEIPAVTDAGSEDDSAADSDDWLSAMADNAPAVPSFDITDAGSEDDSAADSDDWLSAMADNAPAVPSFDITDAGSEGDSAADSDDWLSAMADNAPAVPSFDITDAGSEGDSAADSDDWLSAMADNAPAAPIIIDAATTTGEDDWLAAMADNAPSAGVPDGDDFARSLDDVDFGDNARDEVMDLSSLGFRMDDAPTVDSPSDSPDEFGWLNDAKPDDDADVLDLSADSADEFEWLGDAKPAAAAADDFILGASGDEDGLDWLSESAPHDNPTTLLEKVDDEFALSFLDDTPEQASTALGATFFDDESAALDRDDAALFGLSGGGADDRSRASFSAISEDDDLFMAEESPVELSESSAVSAPDWLNALAPGLEVDTDALDVAPDGEYLGGGRGDYGWLNSLVDEELRPPVMVSKPRTARFPFDTPPAWLKVVRGETQPVSPKTPVQDELDFDGNGLPDWLDSVEFDDDDAQKN